MPFTAKFGCWVTFTSMKNFGRQWGTDEVKRVWNTNYHTHDNPDGKKHWYVTWWLGPFFASFESGPYHV